MRLLVCLILFSALVSILAAGPSYAQSVKTQQGAVLKRGSSLRISGAVVFNKRSNFSVVTNQLGVFSILAAPGDTLEFAATGYMAHKQVVTNFDDVIINLQEITRLDEVTVTGKSLEKELNEVRDAYRSKGVYYGGKPPLLAAIFQPLTAINELFGKSAKQARRFNNFANRELEYQEISRKWNDLNIRKAVPSITDEQLAEFRTDYMPDIEDVRRWNDYDVVVYIRKAFADFKAKAKAQGDSGGAAN